MRETPAAIGDIELRFVVQHALYTVVHDETGHGWSKEVSPERRVLQWRRAEFNPDLHYHPGPFDCLTMSEARGIPALKWGEWMDVPEVRAEMTGQRNMPEWGGP